MATQTIWDKPDVLEFAENMRESRRKKNTRFTFDCFKARSKADKVLCAAGHRLGKVNGSMSLLSVLKGTTSKECKTCQEFDGD